MNNMSGNPTYQELGFRFLITIQGGGLAPQTRRMELINARFISWGEELFVTDL